MSKSTIRAKRYESTDVNIDLNQGDRLLLTSSTLNTSILYDVAKIHLCLPNTFSFKYYYKNIYESIYFHI